MANPCITPSSSWATTFSADGNPDEGLVYFGWISDAATGAVAEVQQAQAPSLEVTLHAGGKLRNLACMVAR
jgi:hypothetical protein